MFACKVLLSQELAEREKEFLMRVSNPLFPRFERFVEAQDQWCIVMEYIPGITLKELICRQGSLNEPQAAEMGCQLAQGLLFLHEQTIPIIYRDLKPENVMIEQDGKVRLIDLGCACFVEEKKDTRAGTRGYAAPEQLESGGRVGVESDVYALGKLLQFAIGVDDRHKLSGSFFLLLEDMTRPDRRQRVPDMHIFLRRMEQFTIKARKKGMKKWVAAALKRRKGRKRFLDFYYKKNVNRGT